MLLFISLFPFLLYVVFWAILWLYRPDQNPFNVMCYFKIYVMFVNWIRVLDIPS